VTGHNVRYLELKPFNFDLQRYEKKLLLATGYWLLVTGYWLLVAVNRQPSTDNLKLTQHSTPNPQHYKKGEIAIKPSPQIQDIEADLPPQ